MRIDLDRTGHKCTALTVDDITQLLCFVATSTFPIPRNNITKTEFRHGGSTIRHHEWILHGRPGNHSHTKNIRTLYDRATILTDPQNREEEEEDINRALTNCHYPRWAIEKGRKQVKRKETHQGGERKKSTQKNEKWDGHSAIHTGHRTHSKNNEKIPHNPPD